MNTERLSALSARLRTYQGPFDVYTWESCACAVASRMPEFNMLGFVNSFGYPCYQAPDGPKHFNFSAAMAFFDLSGEEVRHVFSLRGYIPIPRESITPAMVADQIDAMIRRTKALAVAKEPVAEAVTA